MKATAVAVLAVLAVLAAAPGSSTAEEWIAVGAAINITPEYPVRMYGYASPARNSESDGVAGRLWASALVLGDDAGEGPAVLVTVDSGSVPPEIRHEVLRRLQTQVPLTRERFVLAKSHTHAGPNLRGMRRFSGEQLERITRYSEDLTDHLERVVLEALAARQPGKLSWTQGSVDFAANRRVVEDGKWSGFGAVPEGPVDHDLPLLRVSDAEGKTIAVVVNYACHNTTLFGDFMQLHGDWTGSAREAIESDHPGVVAMVTIGCAGDADPFPRGKLEYCLQHGRTLADEVTRLLAGDFQPVSPQQTARSVLLEIPYLDPPSPEELEQLAARSSSAESLLQRLERGETPPSSTTLEIIVWTFGDDLAMVFLPNEVVVDYALRMKREMDGSRLWVSAYCNEVAGYIVSERLIDEGGYEVRSSLSARISYGQPERVLPSIEERIVSHVRALVPEAFHAKHE